MGKFTTIRARKPITLVVGVCQRSRVYKSGRKFFGSSHGTSTERSPGTASQGGGGRICCFPGRIFVMWLCPWHLQQGSARRQALPSRHHRNHRRRKKRAVVVMIVMPEGGREFCPPACGEVVSTTVPEPGKRPPSDIPPGWGGGERSRPRPER